MKLSDLQNKYVVNVLDGKNVGNIIDVNIDEATGRIISLVIDANHNFFSFGNKSGRAEIYWKNITKIGEDVILVNITL